MEAVRWAVIGTSGFALDWIARSVVLGANAELAAIVSRDEERGRAAAERMGAPLHYRSVEEVDSRSVDGVFVVTPNVAHAPLTIAAARRGLHVIVEKPMAVGHAECRAMVAAAREAHVVLAVAHCMEWSPAIVRARELIAQGSIGVPIQATIAASYNSPPRDYWRQRDPTEAGGGPLYDMGSHAIDAIQRLLGPITDVTAFLDHHIHQYATEDTTSTLVRFESGAHGLVLANFNCSQNYLEIVGTEGRLISRSWWGRDFAGELVLEQGDRRIEQELQAVNVYIPQIEHVSHCVQTGAVPRISGERGLRNIAVIEAAIDAARTGRQTQVQAQDSSA